jgi:hypothetical protein
MKSVARLFSLGLLMLLMAGIPAWPQYGRTPGGSGRSRGASSPRSAQGSSPDEPLPTFAGTLKGIDKKMLTLEGDDSNALEFRCTKQTKYFDGSKSVKSTALKTGDRVSVEARRAPDASLDAVNVRLERQNQQPQ